MGFNTPFDYAVFVRGVACRSPLGFRLEILPAPRRHGVLGVCPLKSAFVRSKALLARLMPIRGKATPLPSVFILAYPPLKGGGGMRY